jgi:ribosomal-protein-alanine N-acetyltransferase
MDQQTVMKPRIETDRLLLRWLDADDIDAFYLLGSEPRVIRYVGNVPFASRDVARDTLVAAPLKDYAVHGSGALLAFGRKRGR